MDLSKIKLGMTRQQVCEFLGPPESVGGLSRKQQTPLIYKYGLVELTFGPREFDGLLWAKTQDHVEAANDVVEAVLVHLGNIRGVGDKLEAMPIEEYDRLEKELSKKVNEALKPYIAPEEIPLNA